MRSYYINQASQGVELFLRSTMHALKDDVRRGVYPDLYAAVKSECERLEAVPKWVQQQMSTTQSYADAVSGGFAEAKVMEGFLAALQGFYKKILYICDPEAIEPVKIADAWPQLAQDVTGGVLAFAALGAFKLSEESDEAPEAPDISDELSGVLNNGG